MYKGQAKQKLCCKEFFWSKCKLFCIKTKKLHLVLIHVSALLIIGIDVYHE